MCFANCHLHSTFSDGVFTPSRLADLAVREGYGAIILTDHDTLRGNYFMAKEARRRGLLSLYGCEFTTVGLGTGFHLLAFDFNPESAELRELSRRGSMRQRERSRLLFEWGLERGSLRGGVTFREVEEAFPDNDYLCNNQIFEVMMRRGIYTFDEYDGFYRANFAASAEVERKIEAATGFFCPDVEEVVRAILKAEGVPVIAHPHGMAKYADELVRMGVRGFETHHPELDADEVLYFEGYCRERGLYRLGGTDHYAALGGFADVMEGHDLPRESGYTAEDAFFDLYRRRLG